MTCRFAIVVLHPFPHFASVILRACRQSTGRALAERSFSESDAIAANLAMIKNILEMDAHG